MRHHKKTRSLNNRFTSWRKATIKSLARGILLAQSIKTTKTRAQAAQPLVEKLISLSKENSLDARRRAFAILGDHLLVSKLFNEIGPRFSKRDGGYTSIFSLGNRRGDDANVVLFSLTEVKKKEVKKHKKAKQKPEEPQEGEVLPAEQEPKAEGQAEEKKKSEVKEEKPPKTSRPQKKFLGGLRNIFKKERDSL